MATTNTLPNNLLIICFEVCDFGSLGLEDRVVVGEGLQRLDVSDELELLILIKSAQILARRTFPGCFLRRGVIWRNPLGSLAAGGCRNLGAREVEDPVNHDLERLSSIGGRLRVLERVPLPGLAIPAFC